MEKSPVFYFRQSKKETAKELSRAQEMLHISSTITDLYFTVQRQQTQLREMERIIVALSKIYCNKIHYFLLLCIHKY